MTALADRQRRLTVTMLIVTVMALVVAGVVAFLGFDAVLDSTGGKDALADNLPITEFPSTPTAVLLTTDAAGALTSATAFALHPSGAGGSIVPVPVSADVGFADDARQTLKDVYEQGGADMAHLALESLLVMTINVVEDADRAELESLLAPTGVDAAAAADTLTIGPGSEPESTRFESLEALWSDVTEAVGQGSGATPEVSGVPTTFADYAERLFAGPVAARGLAWRPLTGDANPEGLDVVEIDRAEVLLVFGSIAPGSVSAPSPGLIFRLEAPPGYEAQVKRTIQKLLFAGGNVVSVDMTRPAQPNTVFLVPDEINRAQAGQTNLIFGEFEFEDPEARIDGVNLTVILGTEYLATVDA